MKTATKNIVLTAKGEINKNIQKAVQSCRFENNKIYTNTWSNKGRNLSSQKSVIESILKAQGYKFEFGNDAPRGGAEGGYIKVSSTAIKFIQSLK